MIEDKNRHEINYKFLIIAISILLFCFVFSCYLFPAQGTVVTICCAFVIGIVYLPQVVNKEVMKRKGDDMEEKLKQTNTFNSYGPGATQAAHVEHLTINNFLKSDNTLDLQKISIELEKLYSYVNEDLSLSLEKLGAKAQISEASEAAKQNDESKLNSFLDKLQPVSEWLVGTATKIGSDVLVAYLKSYYALK